MVVTVLKTNIQKRKPREILYRDFSNFDEGIFREHLKTALSQMVKLDYSNFETTFLTVFNKFVPIKKK